MALDNVDAEIELSPSLQLKVVQSKYASLLQRGRAKGQAFQECSERFLNEMLVGFRVLYLMAGQDIVKKGDIAQELIVLLDGAADCVDDAGESTSMISSSSPDSFPCVGETAFFLGIMQPCTVRARAQTDLRVVALSREVSEALFKKHPGQLELIRRNILRRHGLEADGSPVAGGSDGGGDEDAGRDSIRRELRAAIVRRREEAFARVVLAAKASELDAVRRLWFRGLEAVRDYDGRSLLAHAAVAGAYKVVEFLLEVKAEVNARNRWGETPLDEALRARQQGAVQLLLQSRGTMGAEAMTAALVEAASAGHLETSPDAEQLGRIMAQSHIDPNVGDYDGRTGLHLACANGFTKTAELLIGLRANVNARDRWQGTPLADAVAGGHIAVSNLLRSKGALMGSEAGTTMFFDAAAKGNVVVLRLLHSCDVVVLECKDYDERNALHIAAAEGRLLAVSYLLSQSFSPHHLDRWGSTAMDDALTGGTKYHMFCAKLIQSMGGGISRLKGTDEGTRSLEALDTIQIDDVRKKLKYLNRAGYNHIVPKQKTDEETMAAFEGCMAHIPLAQTMACRLQSTCQVCIAAGASLNSCASDLGALIRPICQLVDTYPSLRQRKIPVLDVGSDSVCRPPLRKLETELEDALTFDNNISRLSTFQGYSGSRRYLVKRLSKIIHLALEDGNIDDEEQMQIDLAWEELTSSDEHRFLQDMGALDSDEETELFADVDNLMGEQEFCEAHGIERSHYIAHKFQSATLKIAEMEAMYTQLCLIFSYCQASTPGTMNLKVNDVVDQELMISLQDLIMFFDLLGEETMHHTPQYEIEAMMEAASKYEPRRRSLFASTLKIDMTKPEPTRSRTVSLRKLVAASHEFRAAILALPVNEAYGVVLQKSNLKELIGERWVRDICESGIVRLANRGEVLFDSEHRTGNLWFVVISGSLSVETTSKLPNQDPDVRSIGNGSFFGGFGHLQAQVFRGRHPECTIRCSSGCQIVELLSDPLKLLKQKCPRAAQTLARQMEEAVPVRNEEYSISNNSRALSTSESSETETSSPSIRRYLMPNLNKIGVLTGNEQVNLADKTPTSSLMSGETTIKITTRCSRKESSLDIVSELDEQEACETSEKAKSTVTLYDLYMIKSSFKCIADLWHCCSCGESTISKNMLYSLQDDLGEVGKGVFRKLFVEDWLQGLSTEKLDIDMFHDIDVEEFWGCWMRLLISRKSDEDAEFHFRNAKDRINEADVHFLEQRYVYFEKFYLLGIRLQRSAAIWSDFFGQLFSLILLRRSNIRAKYLSKEFVNSGIYEKAYIHVVESLNVPLEDDNILLFIKYLFPDSVDQITDSSSYCLEFKEIFGKKGKESMTITWQDINKVLRPILNTETRSFYVGTAFHPDSTFISLLWHLILVLTIYFFISVPMFLCMVDESASMLSTQSLFVFIPADVLAFLCVVIQLNTAYKCTQTKQWITDRLKIAKNMGTLAFVPAVPMDWIAFSLGNRYETCLWIRMSKLLLVLQLVKKGFGTTLRINIFWRTMRQILASLAVLHIFCCSWFFIARKYQFCDPMNPYVWFKPNYPEDDPRYRPNLPTDTNGFEYDMLSCNQTQAAACDSNESWYYFGMGVTDGFLAKYILSLYFIATRITNQGLYGNIVPQNFLEVAFCICFMVLNLTLFRWLIGDLSTSVMESDQGKFEARTKSLKISSFLSKNNFSPDLASEIRLYCENRNDNSSIVKCAKVLGCLPRFLQDEVARHVCRDLLDRLELLDRCSDHLKDLLSCSTTTNVYSPEEYVFRIGEEVNDLFIVQAGAIDIFVESSKTVTGEKVESMLGPGMAVEQGAFFFQLRSVISAKASRTGGAVCLKIGRETFLHILNCFPSDEELVSQNALRTISFFKTESSATSFISDWQSTVKSAITGSYMSDMSAGEHGKSNRNSILQIGINRRRMKLLFLFSAVKAGEVDTLQSSLKGDMISVNDRDDYGRCLLHVAACQGKQDIVEFLLKHSADVTVKDHRGNTPLNEAVLGCYDHIASIIRGYYPESVLSFDGYQEGTLMCEAASAGNLAQVARLIENRVSVNSHDYDKRTALHLAACEGRAEVVRHLLISRAEASFQDRFGNNALDDAIRHGHANIKKMIYDAGARVSGMNTVLKACAASACGDPKAIELTKSLVDNGLDPKAGDYDGRTPLHLAACSGKLGLLEYFISKISSDHSDSHFNVVDRYGNTPLDDAYRHGHTAAVVVLENAGTLRKGDQHLTALINLRCKRDIADQKASLRFKAMQLLSCSLETKSWEYVDQVTLPALTTNLENAIASVQAVLELASRLLPSVQDILQLYVRLVLPSEMSVIQEKANKIKQNMQRENVLAFLGEGGESVVQDGYENVQHNRKKSDVFNQIAKLELQSAFERRQEITRLIQQIDTFLRNDWVAAREVICIDFERNRLLQLAGRGLAKELVSLSVLLRRNAGLLKLIRKLLKDVSKLCITFKVPRCKVTLSGYGDNVGRDFRVLSHSSYCSAADVIGDAGDPEFPAERNFGNDV